MARQHAQLSALLSALLCGAPPFLWGTSVFCKVIPILASSSFPLCSFSPFLAGAFLGLGSGFGGAGLADNCANLLLSLTLAFYLLQHLLQPSSCAWLRWQPDLGLGLGRPGLLPLLHTSVHLFYLKGNGVHEVWVTCQKSHRVSGRASNYTWQLDTRTHFQTSMSDGYPIRGRQSSWPEVSFF